MSMTEDEFEQIVILRERDFVMMGAAISNRSWHDLETAYNSGRDRLDRAMADAERWSSTLSRRETAEDAPKVASGTGAGLAWRLERSRDDNPQLTASDRGFLTEAAAALATGSTVGKDSP